MIRRLIFPCVPFLIVAVSFVPAAQAEIIDRVLAVVGTRPITLSDVNAASVLGLVAQPPTGDPIGTVLSQLIDRQLQLAEVDRYAPPEPPAADVDRELHNVRARFASAADFEAALARCGVDLAQLRETVREDLSIRAYLDQRFSTGEERRDQVIEDWMAGLRRRGNIVNLYVLGR
jgi:hypothetical protein